jgi:hypothetical protein
MSKSDNFCNRYAVLKPSLLFSALLSLLLTTENLFAQTLKNRKLTGSPKWFLRKGLKSPCSFRS